jgi:hypothetical protein
VKDELHLDLTVTRRGDQLEELVVGVQVDALGAASSSASCSDVALAISPVHILAQRLRSRIATEIT